MTAAHQNSVQPATPRGDVLVRFPDGQILSGPRGTTLEHFLRASNQNTDAPVVAALLDGELAELTRTLDRDVSVTPLTMKNTDGMRIYRRSLSFLLLTATHELLPKVKLHIGHAIASGGYFCHLSNRPQLPETELNALNKRMREIVAADEPITRQKIPIEEAIQLFEAAGQDEKARLLKHRTKPNLVVYSMRDTRNYLHGYMVPSSGYLRYFDLDLASE